MILADFFSLTEAGQAFLAILVAVVGYVLHHKANKIEVIMNGRTQDLINRVQQLETLLVSRGTELPPTPPPTVKG